MLTTIITLLLGSLPIVNRPVVAQGRLKIEPLVLTQLAENGQTAFFVWLTVKADLTAAAQLPTKEAKTAFVFQTLRTTADQTQAEIRSLLTARNVPFRAYYIANKIFVPSGNTELVWLLAERPDVARITANHSLRGLPSVGAKHPNYSGVTSNLRFIQADAVWQMGVTGAGVVLAANDSGLHWEHPAIIQRYRGSKADGQADHHYNWWDATTAGFTLPADVYGHGTHVTGIMVGDVGTFNEHGEPNRTGVAPGAQTIHCKMLNDRGKGYTQWAIECLEWNLAPWDLARQNPNPSKAPDVVNNSWGNIQGAQADYVDELNALQAAGIVVLVSAGNTGIGINKPVCQSLVSPGDYGGVITTGSVNHLEQAFPGLFDPTSARGPAPLTPRIKPDVIAPGVAIVSSTPGSNYQEATGTSMAGAHVSGVVALLWQANPALRGNVSLTADLIRQGAKPLSGQVGNKCGGDYTNGPNYDWGYGTINALHSVTAALAYQPTTRPAQ